MDDFLFYFFIYNVANNLLALSKLSDDEAKVILVPQMT